MIISFVVNRKRYLYPIGAGLAGAALIGGIYFGILSLAESPSHALEQFWQDRWFVIPIIVGFGVQAALYTILKLRLFVPISSTGPSGAMLGAGGSTSTLAMVACCAHHVADVLPLLGLTAAAAFLAQYRLVFMAIGLGTTILGIGIMLFTLFRERRRVMKTLLPINQLEVL